VELELRVDRTRNTEERKRNLNRRKQREQRVGG